MNLIELPFEIKEIDKKNPDRSVIEEALKIREESARIYAEEQYSDALRRTVEALRKLREAGDYTDRHFRATLATLLFDLSEIHFALKDYKQSEKELEMLFKILENLLRDDADRFGHFHLLAMELSTRILRSRRKTLDLLAKQQINTGRLYEKVNAGVGAATDKLVESLRKVAEMLASTGDYHAAVKFYAEAIKLAKKRAGKVTRREVKMTVDMAAVMMRSKSEVARARRLLNAILPHAIALETVELEQEILAMLDTIDSNVAHEPMWRSFLEKVQLSARNRFRRKKEGGETGGESEGESEGETEGEGEKKEGEKEESDKKEGK